MTDTRRVFQKLQYQGASEWKQLLSAIEKNRRAQQPSLYDILNCIRDMPYGRPAHRTDIYSCLREWTGTCSDKHTLIHSLLLELGYAPTYWMASTPVVSTSPGLSQQMRDEIAVAGGFYDVHNFVSCDLGNGEIIIDLTFPSYMQQFGFSVSQDLAPGVQSEVCCPVETKIAITHLSTSQQEKSFFLAQLNCAESLARREQVILEFGRFARYAGRYQNMGSAVAVTLSSTENRVSAP